MFHWEISQVYEACGMELGRYGLFEGEAEPGWAVVVPPGAPPPERLGRQVRFAVTGWAVDAAARYRFRVDHALPLSDHAGYDELFEAVERVAPDKVYCTHGPETFVDRLREFGHEAYPLGRPSQGRLF